MNVINSENDVFRDLSIPKKQQSKVQEKNSGLEKPYFLGECLRNKKGSCRWFGDAARVLCSEGWTHKNSMKYLGQDHQDHIGKPQISLPQNVRALSKLRFLQGGENRSHALKAFHGMQNEYSLFHQSGNTMKSVQKRRQKREVISIMKMFYFISAKLGGSMIHHSD